MIEKLENTLENQKAFNGFYIGQSIHRSIHWPLSRTIGEYRGWPVTCSITKGFYLELTPLSQITDEDAIELIKLQFSRLPKGFKLLKFDRSYNNTPSFTYSFICDLEGKGVSEISLLGGSKDFYNKLSIKQYKFAIQKGYYIGDGTEIEYGWVKLKEDK